MKALGVAISFGLFAVLCGYAEAQRVTDSTDAKLPVGRALARRVSLTCDEEPLTDVIDSLKNQVRVRIEVERTVLPESSHMTPSVTCDLKDVPLSEVLRTILSPHGLTYLAKEKERVILIVRRKEMKKRENR